MTLITAHLNCKFPIAMRILMMMKIMMVIMLLMMVAITSRLASIQVKLSDNQGRGFSRSCEGLVFRVLPNFYPIFIS